jgi:hypothetical protein
MLNEYIIAPALVVSIINEYRTKKGCPILGSLLKGFTINYLIASYLSFHFFSSAVYLVISDATFAFVALIFLSL